MRQSRSHSIVIGFFTLAVGLAPAWAESDDRLPPRPQQVAQEWEDLSPEERGQALRNYQRYQRLRPEERRAVDENYDRWRQLPPAEKQRLRGNYERYRQFTPQERQDYQRRYKRWKSGH